MSGILNWFKPEIDAQAARQTRVREGGSFRGGLPSEQLHRLLGAGSAIAVRRGNAARSTIAMVTSKPGSRARPPKQLARSLAVVAIYLAILQCPRIRILAAATVSVQDQD